MQIESGKELGPREGDTAGRVASIKNLLTSQVRKQAWRGLQGSTQLGACSTSPSPRDWGQHRVCVPRVCVSMSVCECV